MKSFKLVVLMILLTLPTNSFAQQTGMDLLRACEAAIQQFEGKEISMEQALDVLYWTGYLAGFNAANMISHVAYKKAPYCPPSQGVKAEQSIRIVHKFLKDHPEDLHTRASVLVFAALNAAFPCKK